jgi:dTMP kinase
MSSSDNAIAAQKSQLEQLRLQLLKGEQELAATEKKAEEERLRKEQEEKRLRKEQEEKDRRLAEVLRKAEEMRIAGEKAKGKGKRGAEAEDGEERPEKNRKRGEGACTPCVTAKTECVVKE